LFLVLSKIVWAVLQPLSMAIILLILGFLLALLRWRRTAWTAITLATLILVVASFTTFDNLLIQPLEGRFARPATPPADVAGIILLGGGLDVEVNTTRKGYEFNRSGDRYVEVLRLAILYPSAKVVMTGGGSVLAPELESEALAAQRFFADFGIAPGRLVYEGESLNTEENARFTRDLLDPQPGEVYLLVTSAFHMPRSVGLFRRAGFDLVPWPVDYQSPGDVGAGVTLTTPTDNIVVASIALREWIGLVAYWLTGRIDEVLPGP
jgi:uncharacterized SAM-binding protein YcdF (DUF218 family)